MKFVYLIFILLFVASCANQEQKATHKKQLFKNQQEAQAAAQAQAAARRRPLYNSQVISGSSSNPADSVMGEDYAAFLASTGLPPGHTPINKPAAGQALTAPLPPSTAPKPEVLEISGNQRKKFIPPSNQSINMAQEEAKEPLLTQTRQTGERVADEPIVAPSLAAQRGRAAPAPVSYYRVSTSASYNTQEVAEIRAMLQSFGSVSIAKNGNNFAAKIIPPEGLKTEAEARAFMNEIIGSSFFDVYIEKIEPAN